MHSFQETHTAIVMSVRPSRKPLEILSYVCSTSAHSFLFNGYMGTLLGVKRPGIEFGHSPPQNNEWSYTSTSPHTPSWCVLGPFNLLPFMKTLWSIPNSHFSISCSR